MNVFSGPPPKPTAIKELQGNPGTRKLNKSEPKPPAVAPHPPERLSREAKAEWRRIVQELTALGMLTKLDRGTLTLHCEAWSDYTASRKQIDLEGHFYKDKANQTCLHPAHKILERATKVLFTTIQHFGLSPAARSRIHIEKPESKSTDPLEELLEGDAA